MAVVDLVTHKQEPYSHCSMTQLSRVIKISHGTDDDGVTAPKEDNILR